MKQFLVTMAGVFAGLALFVIVTPMILVAAAIGMTRPEPIHSHTVLVLDLRGALSDQSPANPLAVFTGRTLSVLGVEQTLHEAATDARVGGLLVRLPEGGMAPAAADELRLAFRDFRSHGKPIVAHSQGIYAEGTAVSTYELAAASGDIWMQPASSFQVTGLAREDIFLGRLFQRHAVIPDYQQRYEYKTAVNPYLYNDYTAAHRASELSWMGSVYDASVASAASDRGQSATAMKAVLEAGPYSAEAAKRLGLIDHIGDPHEAQNALLRRVGGDAQLTEFSDYEGHSLHRGRGPAGAPTIALISAEGDIMTGRGGLDGPFSGGHAIRSDDVARAFYRAIDDSDVRAIVFRISSPGGSDTASEQILAAVRAAKADGKPVVVSMGTYAASGGYWIASQASRIVAEPSTLTGSIGVFGGKFALGEALARFGVDVRGLEVGGDFSDAFGSGAPMSQSQRAAFAAWMDRIYDGFVGRVAQGRGLPVARVREIARGRVWTGAQAKALGLVDELGGLYLAVDRAKDLAGIKGGVRVEPFESEGSPLSALQRLFGGGAQLARILGAADTISQSPLAKGLGRDLATAGAGVTESTVFAPDLR